MANSTTQFLVIGGTGTTGARVVQRLEDAGFSVRIGSRKGTPPFSWADQSTWPKALEGIDRAYIVHPTLVVPEAADEIRDLANTAAKAGVQRLVLLSAHGSEEIVKSAEEAVTTSGLEWTIVRPSWFNQNFDGDFMMGFRDAIRAGELAQPLGRGKFAFVDADDIAAVVVAALTEDGHAGKAYELTGPRLLNFGDAMQEIGSALGREIRYVPLTGEEYRKVLINQGISEQDAEMMVMELPDVDEELGDGVQQALGREPKDFAEYASDAAATGVWDA